jgi:hypothetical protein
MLDTNQHFSFAEVGLKAQPSRRRMVLVDPANKRNQTPQRSHTDWDRC